MRCFIKTIVAASALLAMLGCSKDWPFERTENGKVEIEGGDPDRPPPVYPAVVYGTIRYWRDEPTGGVIRVFDANRTCICEVNVAPIEDEPHPFHTCNCDLSTESPLPWYVCGEATYAGNTWRDEDTITSLSGWYTCFPSIRKKAPPSPGVDLNLTEPGGCQSCY
ncbi:MAG: hypothetical protein ACP5QG_07860 [candidate division WOR-3 bacterium]